MISPLAVCMCTLTCDNVFGGRRTTLVVLHHLQFDLVLLARAQARLLKSGLWTAERVQNLTILLFLPAPKNNSHQLLQRLVSAKCVEWEEKNCQIIYNGSLGGVWTS